MLVLTQLGKAALQFGGLIALSRILAPTDFGIVAVPIAIVLMGELLRDMGLSTAAITKPDLTVPQRNALFWASSLMGLVIAIITIVVSPLLETTFNNPHLGEVMLALSAVFVLGGLGAQYRADLTRSLRFGMLAATEIIAVTCGLVAATIGAVGGMGYWALVLQPIVQAAMITIISGVAARWLPTRPRSAEGFRELLGFGANVSVAQLIWYVGNNVDTFALGMYSSPYNLGLYNRAFLFASQPLNQLKQPATSVALPVLSRYRDDADTFVRLLQRGQLVIAYSVLPIAALLSGCGQPIVDLVLGEQWSEIGPLVSILAIAGGLQQLSAVAGWIFLSKGLGRQFAKYSVVSLGLKLLCIVPLAQFGPLGVSIGFLVSVIVTWPVVIVWASRSAGLGWQPLIVPMIRPLVVASIASAIAYVSCSFVEASSLLLCLIGGLAFVATYGLACIAPAVRRDLRESAHFLRKRA